MPFIDEHSLRFDAPAEAVWRALLQVLRGTMGTSSWFARLLGCEPVAGSVEFDGRLGDSVPGFRVVESEPYRRLALRGRHRFADYALTFVLDGDLLKAQSHGEFPGLAGRCYRAAVISSGGHRVITRRLLRQIVGAARQRR